MNSIATHSVADRFALTLDGLARAVAARIAGGAMAAAMIVLVWGRVKRAERQIKELLARFQAGTLVVRTRPATGKRAGGGGGKTRDVSKRLPLRFGWLLPMVPYQAAGYASQLRYVLAEPEMVALLEASPQARRVLKPLCRMLGVEPEVLGIASVPRVERVKVKRVRKPRPKIDWGRIPLPRGVLAAAKRQGFGKLPRGWSDVRLE